MRTPASQTTILVVIALLASVGLGLIASGGTGIARGWIVRLAAPLLQRNLPDPVTGPTPELRLALSATPTLTRVPLPSPTVPPTPQPTPTATEPPPITPVLSPSATAEATEVGAALAPEPASLVIATPGRLNVRAAPTLDAPIITTLPQGAEATVVGRSADASWVQVQLAGQAEAGWVVSSPTFVILSGDVAALPVTDGAQ